MPAASINKLEELWKTNPDATLADLEKPGKHGTNTKDTRQNTAYLLCPSETTNEMFH
jgi:hypothetical protein